MSEQELRVEDAGDRSTCNVCGAGIVQPRGQGRRRKTCSAACRQQSYMLRRFMRIPTEDEVSLPAAPVVQAPVPTPAPAPDLAVLPDPPAAAPSVVPLPAPKAPRRRSAITASAMPLPPADAPLSGGIDPKGWLRAFDAYDERQASLFEDQGDEDVPAPRGE